MPSINVTRTLDVKTDKLWDLVKDFGGVGWFPGGENAEIRGQGPGMVRVFQGPNGSIEEILESVDESSQTLVYTIPHNLPFPVTSYRSTMVVSDDGGNGQLSWSCEFEPDGVSAEEAGAAVEGMYGVMMGWLQDFADKG